MRKIDTIFVHCSDSDYAHHDDISVIRKWHMDERGFNDVGYHFFITNGGQVQIGRPIDKIPAAQYGYNTGSVAICLSGKHEFTEDQFKALRKMVKELTTKHGIQHVMGHNEVDDGKTCPNFDVKKALQDPTLLERFKTWLSNLS